MTSDCGRRIRLRRLSRHREGRFLFVPLDHSMTDGPILPGDGYGRLVAGVVRGGADAVVVHKGRVRLLDAATLARCGLVLHLSASTSRGPDPNTKVLVSEVEDALRLGADAVSVHFNLGAADEPRQLAECGLVASACQRLGLPLMIMVYARGPAVADERDVDALRHAANVAVDLGADIVKTVPARSWSATAEVVASCSVPLLLAGGPADGQDPVRLSEQAVAAGAAGVAVGRRVFTAADPEATVRAMAGHVHGGRASVPPVAPVAGAVPAAAAGSWP